MILFPETSQSKAAGGGPRIGLALSGGGFRASIFHLGVIRRLEELGIMPHVNVISAVSGGSIVAAYYVCEMEKRLRDVKPGHASLAQTRVRIFEQVADDFLNATDHNLRTRALVYTPFFHPWSFLKATISRPFRRTARAELIQREYDRWFYEGNTLDELPSVTPDQAPADSNVQYGPKLVLNTTSLISGERVAFSRSPVSKLAEMSKVNRNVLLLSRVVGASAGVPGLFPPTSIAGDVLVDGGVSDNQGIEGLLHDGVACDVLLVSDASGQLEERDRVSTGEIAVLGRVNGILMFQLRAKLLEILLAWKEQDPAREFAFIHLFLNLKDRQASDRLPSEYIPGVARIRTDLDQFSFIETEALMYHGYTLIDAQLRENCPELLKHFGEAAPLNVSPLFRDAAPDPHERRKVIQKDLKAGAQNLYLLRCAAKHRANWVWLAAGIGLAMALVVFVLLESRKPLYAVRDRISWMIYGLIPQAAVDGLDSLLKTLGLTTLHDTIQGISGIVALSALAALAFYLVSFPVYGLVRRYSLYLDKVQYRRITGEDWSTHWSRKGPADITSEAAAGKS